MASSSDLVAVTTMSYEETVRFSEEMVKRDDSKIFLDLVDVLAGKLAVMHQSQQRRVKECKKRKVILPNALEPEAVFNITRDYPQYSLVFRHSERVCAPLAETVKFLTTERLMDRVRGVNAGVIGYGFGMSHVIVKDRQHVHNCVSREDVFVASRVVQEDRALCAILNASILQGKTLPMTERYLQGDVQHVSCGDPVSCRVQGRAGVMNLIDIDTNYLQVCCWMRQHGVQLAYISLATNKGMELGYDGEYPEMDAYVMNQKDSYHLIYKGAVAAGRTFRRVNHLSLIAKTYERVGEYTFVKEFCDRVGGVSTYKITMAKTALAVPDVEYRSWCDEGIRDSYLVSAYELRERHGDLNDPSSYVKRSFQQPKQVIDKLVEYAMRLESKQFTPQVLMERLRTDITTSVYGGYSMKCRTRSISDRDFVAVALAVYARVFTRKYYRPQTDRYVMNQIRQASALSDCGVVTLALTHVSMLYHAGVVIRVDKLMSRVKQFVKGWFIPKSAPIDDIEENAPFMRYRDSLKPREWMQSKDWRDLLGNPWESMHPQLPGFEAAVTATDGSRGLLAYNPVVAMELQEAMSSVVGEKDEDEGVIDVTEVSEPVRNVLMIDVPQERKPVTNETDVKKIVQRVTEQTGQLVDVTPTNVDEPVVFMARTDYQDVPLQRVVNPLPLVQGALGRIFPGSVLMDTCMVGSDVHYGGFDIIAQAVKVKITSSKLKPMRPDMLYKPLMATQVLPNVRQTLPAMLPTIVKRNLNTSSSVEPMCLERAKLRVWENMKAAYYVDDIEDRIASWDFIGPTDGLVGEWASKLAPTARVSLVENEFDVANLDVAIQDSKLMLKGKRKPNLGPTYGSAVKAAQSIQYDGSKRRTAIYSPLFAEKVRRDRSVLRDNVIIMQSKSIAELNKRLSCFDWRATSKGPLKYLMLDGEMFDKSQVLSTLEMHWYKCEKFKILPELVETLRQNAAYRKASSQEAGIQVYLTPQRGSGDSDTLDGNCDVSQSAYARFLAEYRDQIEFILIMGDDVTVAFRGEMDIMHLERECMSEFNLSVKATISEYGNFVSGWLVHLPDGAIRWVTDPVKRAVALGDRAVVCDTIFEDKFLAFKDLCVSLDGHAVRDYLVRALTVSYSRDLGYEVCANDMMDLVTGVVSIASDFEVFRKFFSETTIKHNY